MRRDMRMRRMIPLVVGMMFSLATLSAGQTLGERRKAAWLSVGHPGLGEYYNAGWGDFFEHCPQRKFWLGLIPIYGWPGYLQVLSAIDAYHGRVSDNLRPID
ncbi:MAG: hypothetical protein E6J77_04370 [Deltaproteobacteria bacterium]|nr:MAG: hypothetical protein E6J77_04370 [Deltaproteobacteria bacterium]